MTQLFYFEGQLAPENSKTHIVHSFNIEDHIKKLIFTFSYEPKKLENDEMAEGLIRDSITKYTGDEKEEVLKKWRSFLPLQNLVTISIDDPIRFRGAAHRHSPNQELFITMDNASPGLINGEIVPGIWAVTVSAHAVVTEKCNYKLSVYKQEED